MTDHTHSSVGIDISKAHLDAHMVPAGKAARFSNDAAGLKALIAWIERPVRSVTYEPTGRWHRAFEAALFEAELPLCAGESVAGAALRAGHRPTGEDRRGGRAGCWRRWGQRWTCGEPRPRRQRSAPSRNCRSRATRWSRTAPPP